MSPTLAPFARPSRKWSANSWTAAISNEGSARFSEAEYLHFLDTAYGSACEVEYQIGLASRLGFLAEPSYRELGALSLETCKVLNGLLRSLRKR